MKKPFEVFQEETLHLLKDYYATFVNDGDGSQIVICGSGRRAQLVYCLFKKFGASDRIVAFCEDMNITKQFMEGIPVLPYQDCEAQFGDVMYYITGYYRDEIEQRFKNRKEEKTIKATGLIDYLEETVSECFGMLEERDIFLPPCSKLREFMKECEQLYTSNEGKEKIQKVSSLLVDETSKKIVEDRVNLFTTGKIQYLEQLTNDEQIYFCDEYYSKKLNGVFLDIGAYIGDSLDGYIKYMGNDYGTVISIEPDYDNYMALNTYILQNHLKNCYTYLFATGREKKIECFTNTGAGYSSVGMGNDLMHVEALDDLFLDEQITLMKMDVEGAELDTLEGAKQIIKKWKPNLAISIYHQAKDIIEIPLWVHELVPDYTFKIRHHGDGNIYDTVLYASVG